MHRFAQTRWKIQSKGEDENESTKTSSPWDNLTEAFDKATTYFETLSPSQQAWLIASSIGALFIIPKMMLLVLVAAERLLVGGLLAAEAVLGSLLLRSAVFLVALAAFGLVLWGLKAFVIDGKKSTEDEEEK